MLWWYTERDKSPTAASDRCSQQSARTAIAVGASPQVLRRVSGPTAVTDAEETYKGRAGKNTDDLYCFAQQYMLSIRVHFSIHHVCVLHQNSLSNAKHAVLDGCSLMGLFSYAKDLGETAVRTPLFR